MMRDYSIRNAGPEDWSAITDICVRTADKGQDGRRCFSDHEYPGLLWALPYLAVEPEQAFVLTHSTGRRLCGRDRRYKGFRTKA